jgi:hypothetical protein
VQHLRGLRLDDKTGLEEFLNWHRHILIWGLGKYVTSYVVDLENALGGGKKRQSLVQQILSTENVTASADSEENPAGIDVEKLGDGDGGEPGGGLDDDADRESV